MKIRKGFVSNSSTTSFAVYGVVLDFEEAVAKFLPDNVTVTKVHGCKHEFDRDHLQYCGECGKPSWEEKSIKKYKDEYSAIYNALEKMGLDCEYDGEGGILYVGYNVKIKKGREKLSNKIEYMQAVDKKLREMFPYGNIDFCIGEYAS